MSSPLSTTLLIAVLLAGCRPVLPKTGAADPCAEPVATEAGRIRGTLEDSANVCVWRGVPFAAPPVGERRWRAPEPVAAWTGLRDATRFAPRCSQPSNWLLNRFNADPSGSMSEDCLYLNVWRPRAQGRYPVLVWFHGGGYGVGTPNTPMYWGDRIAQDGKVIVVGVAYRLGPLGFLALPALRAEDAHGATGGYGSLDQVAALRWVQRNIEGFGGDPGNVTIFGESAGGWSICTLYATPLAKGLFQKAIMQSGGCTKSQPVERGFAAGEKVARAVGCDPGDLGCLRRVDPAKLFASAARPTFTGFTVGPHEDGYLLTGSPLEMIERGEFNRVPFLAGTTRDELLGPFLLFEPKLAGFSAADFRRGLVERFGRSAEESEALVKLYPLERYGGEPRLAYAAMATDAIFACPTFNGLAGAVRRGVPAWMYRCDHDRARVLGNFGALHGAEVPLVFASHDRAPLTRYFSAAQREAARPVSAAVRAHWLTFARLADPSVPWLPPWPRLDPDAPRVQALARDLRSVEVPDLRDRCAFWSKAKPLDLGW